MTKKDIDTLDDYLFELKKQMEIAKYKGIRGNCMAQRIDGDLKRIMSSAYLNLCELIADCDKLADAIARTEKLESAIHETIDDNLDLADGDNCTLIKLKQAIE